jgi:hypothetical protein
VLFLAENADYSSFQINVRMAGNFYQLDSR